MGITSNDIAAQRAMLQRGEEKRKADWKQAERERLRDTFAAAALPLCTRNGRNAEQISESAYKLADAMLRERESQSHAESDGKRTNTNMNRDTTPSEGSVRGEGTLTDEEREAIEDAAGICEEHAEEYDGTDSSPTSDKLRSLLERLK